MPEPKTTQKVKLAQETEWNALPNVPGPLAASTFVQPVPFHVSARRAGEVYGPDWPTARQNVSETQATELSWLNPMAGRVGPGETSHEDPFQVSLRVEAVLPLPVYWNPTATHHELLRHETPLNPAPVPAANAAAAVMAHVVPFQVSISPLLLPAPSPTATQKVGPAHDTPVNRAELPTAGVLVFIHDAPFQLCTKGARSG
jgi:hypothetical protein